jgi:hypothetical protein
MAKTFGFWLNECAGRALRGRKKEFVTNKSAMPLMQVAPCPNGDPNGNRGWFAGKSTEFDDNAHDKQ